MTNIAPLTHGQRIEANELIFGSPDSVFDFLVDTKKWSLYNPHLTISETEPFSTATFFTTQKKEKISAQIIKGLSQGIFFCNYKYKDVEWFAETKVETINEYTVVKVQMTIPNNKHTKEITSLMQKSQDCLMTLKEYIEEQHDTPAKRSKRKIAN